MTTLDGAPADGPKELSFEPDAFPEMEAAGLTDPGRLRDRNEDVFLIATLERALLIRNSNLPPVRRPHLSRGAGGALLVVADGMGGPGGGDVASSVAVATVADYMLSRMPWVGQSAAFNAPLQASLPGVRAG